MSTLPLQLSNDVSELMERIAALVSALREEAKDCDQNATFPFEGMATLRAAGLLVASVPVEFRGLGLCGAEGAQSLFQLLHLLGDAHLAVGRIFEAHVNALELVRRYGTEKQMETAAQAAQAGDLFALWVTDSPKNRLRLSPSLVLTGEKWFCSAAGVATRALVTAETEVGPQMVFVTLNASARVTDQGIKLAGMRAATTGSVDLTGVVIREDELIGNPSGYLREPVFSTGAWRSSAVALGGVAALIEAGRIELRSRGRADDPYQRMRFGQAVIAHETGRLWMLQAARRAESATEPGEDAVAYVNLARTAVETAGLDVIRLIQRSLGLSAFMQGSSAERIARDLATYLRQPAPDEALEEAAGYFMNHGVVTS